MNKLYSVNLPCVAIDREALVDVTSLSGVLSKQPSVVIHLAAVVPKPPTISDDQSNAKSTRIIDRAVLEAVDLWNCHVIYASGCSLYTKGGPHPCREMEIGDGPELKSPYLSAKLKGEGEFLASGRATVLRISTPVGEGLSTATVLGRFMLSAKMGRRLEVWGSGFREQNYVDVEDLADAFFRAVIVRPTEVINIAADYPFTMLELAQKVVQIYGRGSVFQNGKSDPGDGETARYSNQRAFEILGWQQLTPLEASLARLRSIF
jgi:nucleoside-diphosphate-sugar epimerase